MLFPTFTFAAFFVLVLVANAVLARTRRPWMLAMLLASYAFYGWGNWRFVGLLIASTVCNQGFARACHRAATAQASRRWVGVAVVANLACLGWFKYYGFFVTDVVELLGPLAPSLPVLRVALPIGISFFTFQALSYVIDVQRGDAEPASQLEFAVYLAFFPQLVAGPIVRATEFLPQLRDPRRTERVDLTPALVLIAAGLFKKVVIAGYLSGALVDSAFGNPTQFTGPALLVAVYGYAIQIYADFSGYTDIAIGLALLLGFRFPTNFDRPYAATSLQEFWRRWHMTLTRWLRDYLYIPLGGNRRGARLRDRNLLVTMLLGGLWHGAAWTFVVWGGVHGVGLLVERRLRRRPDSDKSPVTPVDPASGRIGTAPDAVMTIEPVKTRSSTLRARFEAVVGWFITFHLVAGAWIFFRADSFGTAITIIKRILRTPGGLSGVPPMVLVVVVASLLVQFVPRTAGASLCSMAARTPWFVQAAAFGLMLVAIDLFGPEGLDPFIYFRF